jgi:hypothetical protein
MPMPTWSARTRSREERQRRPRATRRRRKRTEGGSLRRNCWRQGGRQGKVSRVGSQRKTEPRAPGLAPTSLRRAAAREVSLRQDRTKGGRREGDRPREPASSVLELELAIPPPARVPGEDADDLALSKRQIRWVVGRLEIVLGPDKLDLDFFFLHLVLIAPVVGNVGGHRGWMGGGGERRRRQRRRRRRQRLERR